MRSPPHLSLYDHLSLRAAVDSAVKDQRHTVEDVEDAAVYSMGASGGRPLATHAEGIRPQGADPVGVYAVVPLSAAPRIKTRLAGVLALGERAALARWMVGRVLDALRASAAVDAVALVSPDEEALAWATTRGVIALRQEGRGLNAALEIGRRWASGGRPHADGGEWESAERPEEGSHALLVLLGDLPYLTPEDVTGLVRALPAPGDGPAVVLAPDRHERGTNALLLRPPGTLPFAFGRDSFQRHEARALALGVKTVCYISEGTRRDVDTPDDLAALIASGLWHPATVS